jgi:hypothetical protein
VGLLEAELGGVLDRHHPLLRREEAGKGVQERRLAGAGAARDQRGDAGAEHALELKWDAARACYTASFAGDLSAQPLRLSLIAFGKAYSGAAASLKAVAAARMDARAQLNVGASAQLGVPEPNVDAAAGAGARAAADAKAQLNASVKAGAKAAADVKASVKAPSVKAPSAKLQKSASATTSSKASGGKVKASAGVKAGVHLGF